MMTHGLVMSRVNGLRPPEQHDALSPSLTRMPQMNSRKGHSVVSKGHSLLLLLLSTDDQENQIEFFRQKKPQKRMGKDA